MVVPKTPALVYDSRGRVDDCAWGMIASLRSEDVAVREIARRLNLTPGAVRYQLRFTVPPSKRVACRAPPSVSKKAIAARRRQVKKLITECTTSLKVEQRARSKVTRNVVVFRCGSPAKVVRELAQHNINTSRSTVRRDIAALGIKCFKRPKRPRQENDDRKRRVAFANRMLRLGKAKLERLHFTDEKWFDSDDHGNLFQYVEVDGAGNKKREVHPRCTSQYPKKIHIWGCIGVGMKRLVIHVAPNDEPGAKKFGPGRPRKGEVRPSKEQREKAKRCLVSADVHIKKCLQPMFPKRVAKDSVLLMQDGASCHTAKVTRDWLKRRGVTLVEGWPARSPDLNPIENLWSLLSRRVSQRGPLSVEELKAFVQHEWDALTSEEVGRFVKSFRSRLLQVVKSKGAHL